MQADCGVGIDSRLCKQVIQGNFYRQILPFGLRKPAAERSPSPEVSKCAATRVLPCAAVLAVGRPALLWAGIQYCPLHAECPLESSSPSLSSPA